MTYRTGTALTTTHAKVVIEKNISTYVKAFQHMNIFFQQIVITYMSIISEIYCYKLIIKHNAGVLVANSIIKYVLSYRSKYQKRLQMWKTS